MTLILSCERQTVKKTTLGKLFLISETSLYGLLEHIENTPQSKVYIMLCFEIEFIVLPPA